MKRPNRVDDDDDYYDDDDGCFSYVAYLLDCSSRLHHRSRSRRRRRCTQLEVAVVGCARQLFTVGR